MRLLELRIPLPLNVEEYQIGQLFSIADTSRKETGGGQGIKVMKNEPFSNQPQFNGKYSNGQYTHKEYKFDKKVNKVIRALVSQKALRVDEESWNAYPFCRTVIDNKEYFADSLQIEIISMHLPDAGTTDNVFNLNESELAIRELFTLNISDNVMMQADDLKFDVSGYKAACKKHPLPPLTEGWINKATMCAYKLIRIKVHKFGIQTVVESKAIQVYQRLYKRFHRQMILCHDKWCCMSMDQLRAFEVAVKRELEENFNRGEVCGMGDEE